MVYTQSAYLAHLHIHTDQHLHPKSQDSPNPSKCLKLPSFTEDLHKPLPFAVCGQVCTYGRTLHYFRVALSSVLKDFLPYEDSW